LEFWIFHTDPDSKNPQEALRYSRTIDSHGQSLPAGPLINFMVAALSGLPNPPNAYTTASIIDRERNRPTRHIEA
jgi:hypothetical protein